METKAEYQHAKNQLMQLDRSVLVDALLKLAIESPSAAILVNNLISSKEQRIALFRELIHRITHQSRRSMLSGDQILDMLKRSLELLHPEELDPKVGLVLMEEFYGTDSWAFESTTELDFEFDCIYSDEGVAKFSEFAERCCDADFVQQVLQRLLATDHYSAREKLRLR
jgi:hypothetical protein